MNDRLNELTELVNEKERTLSHNKFDSWCRYSPEYMEYLTLKAQAQTIANREQAQVNRDAWKNDPASQKQYDFIDRLNVNLNGRRLTKGEASRIIDAVKSGEGIGQFGLSFYSGSN